MQNLLDVYIITNGRSTFKYALRLLQEQSVDTNVVIVKDMSWIDACNYCLHQGKAPFYLRVDDDMLVHPRAVEYYTHLIQTQDTSNSVMVNCKLWEPWNSRIISGLKAYNRELTKTIGFEVDNRGKVDKIFRRKFEAQKYVITGDKYSAVGIHAACTYEENMKYVHLRNEQIDPTFLEKNKELIRAAKAESTAYPLDKQYELAKELHYNAKYKTPFFQFLA